jgi:hypothetical protein
MLTLQVFMLIAHKLAARCSKIPLIAELVCQHMHSSKPHKKVLGVKPPAFVSLSLLWHVAAVQHFPTPM